MPTANRKHHIVFNDRLMSSTTAAAISGAAGGVVVGSLIGSTGPLVGGIAGGAVGIATNLISIARHRDESGKPGTIWLFKST